jgi:hypothetical protein
MILLDLFRLRIKLKMFWTHEFNKVYFVSGKGTRCFGVIISLRQGDRWGIAEASYFWRKKAACEFFIITRCVVTYIFITKLQHENWNQ